jgi:PIN domain nuclease of toxin-antitoxin system
VAERYLLDTSAILTLTDKEDGFEKVEELLDQATAGAVEVEISAVSLMDPELEPLASEIALLTLPYKRAK